MVKPELKIENVAAVVADDHLTQSFTSEIDGGAASKRRPSNVLIILAFAAVYLIWGSTYLAIKYAIGTLPPFLMAATRFLTAGAILFAWASFRGASSHTARPSLTQWKRAFLIGALLLLCGNGGVTWAERYLASGLTALLIATEPLWVVMLGWALGGGRPNPKVLLGLFTGLAGVGLLVSSGFNGGSGNRSMNLIGGGVVIAAALAWAGGSVYSTRRPVQASTSLASGMQMLAGGVLLLLFGLLTGEYQRLNLSNASWVSLGALCYLIVFGSIVAFTAYSWLLRTVAPARAATYAYVNPVVAVLLGWVVASEPVTVRTLVAAAVIVASVALITTFGKKRPDAVLRTSTKDASPDLDPCPTHPCA